MQMVSIDTDGIRVLGGEIGMWYDIKTMKVDGKKIHIQDGRVERCTSKVIFWMGTPPSEEDLKPRECMRIHWNRAAMPRDIDIETGFHFEIITTEGDIFIGKACYPGMVSYPANSNLQMVEYDPFVLEFQETLVI